MIVKNSILVLFFCNIRLLSFQEECNLEGIINTKLASNEETGGGQKPDMNGNAVAKHRKYSHG